MNKHSLDRIRVPQGLPSAVDRALDRARRDEAKAKRKKRLLKKALPAVAAALALIFLSLNFSVIAEAAARAFIGLRAGVLHNASRDEIIGQNFVASATRPQAAPAQKNSLALQNYYVTKGEIAFELLLSGAELPEGFKIPIIGNFELEMLGGAADGLAWRASYDEENEIDSRIFPGGHFLSDGLQGRHEYVGGDFDFVLDAAIERIDEHSAILSAVVRFRKPLEELGNSLKLDIHGIRLWRLDEISKDKPEDQSILIDGDWSFEMPIDERFTQAQELNYSATDPAAAAQKGIAVQSVRVDPSASMVELIIDYSKNNLVDRVAIKAQAEKQYWTKHFVMNTTLHGELNGRVLSNPSWDFYPEKQEGEKAFLWAQLDSVYFDDAEGFTLVLTEIDGNRIEIPLQIVK
ncbi:MAG: hypothetical protein LBD02_05050 [Christensenellaceae bacterium]|jgi:hypothetical protein|nr:hypothetical protein [Christensenellaceae bacterium]